MEFIKGQRFRSFDDFGNYWDIEVQGEGTNCDYVPSLRYLSMKNGSGQWLEDMGELEGCVYAVESGRWVRVELP